MKINPVEKVIKLEIWYFGYSGVSSSIRILIDYLDQKEIVERIDVPIGQSIGFNDAIIIYNNEHWWPQIHIRCDENIYVSEVVTDLYHKEHPISLDTADGFTFVVDSHKSYYNKNIKYWNRFVADCKQLKTSKPPIVFNFHHDEHGARDNINPMTFLDDIKYHEFIDGKIEEIVFLTDSYLTDFYLGGAGTVASFKKLLVLILSRKNMTIQFND